MDLEMLKSFVMIAEMNNITLAAEELNMSPSALSGSLQKLEKELGCSLFDRTAKGMRLTGKGKYFLEWAKKHASFKDKFLEKAEESAAEKGIIKIGTMINNDTLFIMLSAFQERYPDIRIDLYDEKAILDNYLMSPLDAFVIPKELRHGQPGILLARRTTLLVLMRESHPLASREQLTPEDLKDQDFVFTAHGGKLDWTYDYCVSQEIHPNVRYLCEEFDGKLDILAYSDTLAIGYNTMRQLRESMKGIKTIPLVSDEKVDREFYFVWRKEPINPLMNRLSAFAEEFDQKGREFFLQD